MKSATDGTFPSVGKKEDGKATCLYRADRTAECKSRCVAGLFIPNDRYDPSIEGNNFNDTGIQELATLPDGITARDITGLQSEHDELAAENWDANTFIRAINDHPCFGDVNRAEPPANA